MPPAHLIRLQHVFAVKGRIYNKVSIIGHNGAGCGWNDELNCRTTPRVLTLFDGHSEGGFGRPDHLMQVVEDLCVCEGDDFYGYPGFELDRDMGERSIILDVGNNARWFPSILRFSGNRRPR